MAIQRALEGITRQIGQHQNRMGRLEEKRADVEIEGRKLDRQAGIDRENKALRDVRLKKVNLDIAETERTVGLREAEENKLFGLSIYQYNNPLDGERAARQAIMSGGIVSAGMGKQVEFRPNEAGNVLEAIDVESGTRLTNKDIAPYMEQLMAAALANSSPLRLAQDKLASMDTAMSEIDPAILTAAGPNAERQKYMELVKKFEKNPIKVLMAEVANKEMIYKKYFPFFKTNKNLEKALGLGLLKSQGELNRIRAIKTKEADQALAADVREAKYAHERAKATIIAGGKQATAHQKATIAAAGKRLEDNLDRIDAKRESTLTSMDNDGLALHELEEVAKGKDETRATQAQTYLKVLAKYAEDENKLNKDHAEFIARSYSQGQPTATPEQGPPPERTIVKSGIDDDTGERIVFYSDDTVEIFPAEREKIKPKVKQALPPDKEKTPALAKDFGNTERDQMFIELLTPDERQDLQNQRFIAGSKKFAKGVRDTAARAVKKLMIEAEMRLKLGKKRWKDDVKKPFPGIPIP